MEALDHMLTDPLEPGAPETNGGIMEECMLGKSCVRLPEDLLEDPEIFFSVLSESTWTDVLSEAQREHLSQFLPSFPEDNSSQQQRTVTSLFNNHNFSFGNPLHLAQKLFRDGYFNPEVVKYRRLVAKSQRRRQLYCLQQYYHKLLNQILISRKELLECAARGGPELALRRRISGPDAGETRERRVRRRVERILREVRSECGAGDSTPSSDDDDEVGPWLKSPPSPSSPTLSVPLKVLPSLSTQDMKSRDKVELVEKDLRALLRRHREKRKHQPDHPDLMTRDLHLGDIMSRVNIGRKGSAMALCELALPKKRAREERKRRKMRPTIKVEAEDPSELLMPPTASSTSTPTTSSSGPGPGSSTGPGSIDPTTPTLPLATVKEEPMEEGSISSPAVVEEIALSFFHLLENILRQENLATSALLEERIQQWQTSPASTLNPWYSLAPCWSDLVQPALHFLAGETKPGVIGLPSGFSPFVDFHEHTQQWKWLAPVQDGEKDLSALCQLWLESKDHVTTKEEDGVDGTPPAPRVWTDYVVRPSTGEERHNFQEQEQQRYDQPHKAFTYRMHGFESVVGPVKGVFDKETSLNKAREHSLLRSDRPAYVTILSLVRDAAARLPNGEGTRAEICELLKDSQFLAPDVTSAQVNTVVSGALDRLHYEKDPCVKYDIGRKLWIYLHRDRSQEEFERIHQAQAAAAKAKKALQQKPKPATKPKGVGKEGGSKTPGTPEAGSSGSGEGPALPSGALPPPPTTPSNTPKSPLPTSTPTKAGIPDAVKTSPGVLLVSPPAMPQLGTLLSAGPAGAQAPQASAQPGARVVAHPATSSLPQVRVVTAQPGLQTSAAGHHQTPTLVHSAAQHIRVPVSMAHSKGITQTVVSLPLRTQTAGSPVQVQTSRGQTLTVSGLASAVMATKPPCSSPGSPAHTPTSPAILKQVAITGQLKAQAAGLGTSVATSTASPAGIPLTATNLRIQGKDVLRLPPSSITTDAKGQTVLRITPDMMATLTKSPMATVKLTPDMLTAVSTAAGTVGTAGTAPKALSATLHVTGPSTTITGPVDAKVVVAGAASGPGGGGGGVKGHVVSSSDAVSSTTAAIRLMPALAVTVPGGEQQKGRGFASAAGTATVVSPTSVSPGGAEVTVGKAPGPGGGTTIRIMPGLGVISPQKATSSVGAMGMGAMGMGVQGISITAGSTVSVNVTTTGNVVSVAGKPASVAIATSSGVGVVGGAKGVVTAGAAGGVTATPLSIGAAGTVTVRQAPVSATVVATQAGKLPARITVPLSVLSQPLKSKSVVTTPLLKGNISTNLSTLGRNIILTTMPAGTKLIAGNKPVSFVTAQQLQQLQQQGQATQVRIQTVPAQQLQQRTASGSPKSVSTVVVTTAPSPKKTPDPQ
ncbi:nuclear factor related to kappa-B-binding protein isoform X2 [Engraulis encrasicolus]|uniref:nuclear factor related to kappa-B-binding protein isoform X2 n=1 Tax=Engraulis encrasicolus TaxID=184585 RepID=UPI002FD3B273